MDIWDILGIIAIASLALTIWIGRNAIWGALTIGAIGGLVYCLITNFSLYKEILIASVLAGLMFEMIGRLANTIYAQRMKSIAKKRVKKQFEDEYGT